jgi:hypothetical protein
MLSKEEWDHLESLCHYILELCTVYASADVKSKWDLHIGDMLVAAEEEWSQAQQRMSRSGPCSTRSLLPSHLLAGIFIMSLYHQSACWTRSTRTAR